MVAPTQILQKRSSVDILKSVLMRSGSYYLEPLNFTALSAASVTKKTFTNQDNVPFLIQKITAYGSIDSSAAKTLLWNVTLKDSGRSQLLMSAAVHASAWGDSTFPTVLDVPYLIRGSATFEAEVTNNHTAAISVWLTFIGYKVQNINM